MSNKVLAFDFGASSGRAIIGELKNGKITLEEVHRFDNDPVMLFDGFYWDVLRLFHEIKQGIIKAKNEHDFESIGIDTWGVDYGMIGKDGKLVGNVYNYRDARTKGIPDEVANVVSKEELYKITGIQLAELNTIFQLYAGHLQEPEKEALTDKILLMPDLFNYFLTGKKFAEYTIASTTELLDPHTKKWHWDLIEKLGFNKDMFPEVIPAGTVVGEMLPALSEELDTTPKKVIAVCGHDTASAVAAPAILPVPT